MTDEAITVELPGGFSITSYPAPDPLPETLEETRERAFDELREVRAPMLNAVTGIMATALTDGDEALAEEAKSIRQQLLDVTLDPNLLAADSYEKMKLAGQTVYRRIAKSASPGFAAVFKETTGA